MAMALAWGQSRYHLGCRCYENVAWKVDTPNVGLAQPVVAGEKVFITADLNLLYVTMFMMVPCFGRWLSITLSPCLRKSGNYFAEQAFWDERWTLYPLALCLHDLERLFRR